MLTKRQQQLVDYLKSERRVTGVMPSTRDIQKHFGFASQTAAVSHLRALEKKGVIVRQRGKARAVAFPEDLEREEIVDIPLFGSIAAGMAESVDAAPDSVLSVDAGTLGLGRSAETFALKVRGESMIDAHIMDGDYVILEKKEPKHEDVVAALIDGETTLKRFIQKGRGAYLQAENEDFPDLVPVEELSVQGVMVGLMRCHHGGRRF